MMKPQPLLSAEWIFVSGVLRWQSLLCIVYLLGNVEFYGPEFCLSWTRCVSHCGTVSAVYREPHP